MKERLPADEIGGFRLNVVHHADCLDAMRQLPDGCVDAVVTDVPYAMHNHFGTNEAPSGTRTMSFDFDDEACVGDILGVLTEAARIARGCVFSFCGWIELSPILLALDAAGFTSKAAAWVKTCPPPAHAGNWWPSAWEPAVFAYRHGAWFGETDPKRNNVFVGDSLRAGNGEKVGHPTQKPLWLMEKIVKAVCPPGGIVLDPYSGSGTTSVACVRNGRRFLGFEIKAEWADLSNARIAAEHERLGTVRPSEAKQGQQIGMLTELRTDEGQGTSDGGDPRTERDGEPTGELQPERNE